MGEQAVRDGSATTWKLGEAAKLPELNKIANMLINIDEIMMENRSKRPLDAVGIALRSDTHFDSSFSHR
jgi:hypothetical protein